MSAQDIDILDLVARLAQINDRSATAALLARHLGVEVLLFLLRDPDIGVMVPAGGFPSTMPGGPAWRALLKRCEAPGRHEQDVDFPSDTHRPAVALAREYSALVLVGGSAVESELRVVERMLPLIEATLIAEQRAALAEARAAHASEAALRAYSLADALEASRAEGANLNGKLREEHRRKDEFLAMLGHELRNPLSPLLLSVDVLRRDGAPTARAEQLLAVMDRQVHQLARLVDDLLDVARVSRGRIELKRAPVMLHSVVGDALESARPYLNSRGHRLDTALPESEVYLDADCARLTQVLANLLHNAGKYTDAGGSIRLVAEADPDWVHIRVSDNGIGIAPQVLPDIFDLFMQAPVSLDRSQGGLGLGLTLVKRLVELHGGQVSAHSEGPGLGSTFSVTLPRAPAPPRREPGVDPAADAIASQTILVVDDNQDAANALADLLRIMGHPVDAVYGSSAALEAARARRYDLILLDLGLPDIDGYEVARRMRREGVTARLVAVTGYGSAEDKRQTRSTGFHAHLVKPATRDQLRAVLSQGPPPEA